MPSTDIAVIGGGVKGAANFYALTYTNADVVLIEKYKAPGLVNSNMLNNSQTLHVGDIETNFTLGKALKVRAAALHTQSYLSQFDAEGAIHSTYHKMVIGAGEETGLIKARFEEFRQHYPYLQLLGPEEIGELEPGVMQGRKGEISAIYSPQGHAVDYGMLAQSFVDKGTEHGFRALFERNVLGIRRDGLEYIVQTNKEEIRAKAVIVSAGAQSLLFAKQLGYGTELAILPVAGSFYYAKEKLLNGKVYTVQDNHVPLAAIHGDPEAHNAAITRFGPTAKVVPLLERRHYDTLVDFIRTGSLGLDSLLTLKKVLEDNPALGAFIRRNMAYEVPIRGSRAFAETVRKIVPEITEGDLTFAKGVGGLRPQVMNTKTRELHMGQVTIKGENILFNMTPSPGASVCLGDGFEDATTVIAFLGGNYSFDRERYERDFMLS